MDVDAGTQGAAAAGAEGQPGSPPPLTIQSMFAKADTQDEHTPSPASKKSAASMRKGKPPEKAKAVDRSSLKAFLKVEKRPRSPSPKAAPPPKKQASLVFQRVAGPCPDADEKAKSSEPMVIDSGDEAENEPAAANVEPADQSKADGAGAEAEAAAPGTKRPASGSAVAADADEDVVCVAAPAAVTASAQAASGSASAAPSRAYKKAKKGGRKGATQVSAQQMAAVQKKLGALQDASQEEHTEIWDLAARFRQFLQKEKKVAESAAVELEKVLCALFEEDEKSFEAMASPRYESIVALVVTDKEEKDLRAECLRLYQEFWPQRLRYGGGRGTPRSALASESTKYEAKVRHTLGLFPDWGLVVRNSRKGQLVTITAPDGRKWHSAEEAKEPIRLERERRVASLAQKSQALQDEHAPTLLAIIRRERTSFVLRDGGSGAAGTLSTRRLVGVFVQSREMVNGRHAFERCDQWLRYAKEMEEPECCFCAWSAAQQCWAFAAAPNPDEASGWWGSCPDCRPCDDAADLVKALSSTSGRWSRHCEGKEARQDQAISVHATTPDELLKAAAEFLRQRQRICQVCSAFPDDDDDPFAELESGNRSIERAQWETFADVPDATPDEIRDFPRVVCTFERYLKEQTSIAASSRDGYTKSLKAIFEDTPKCPEEMATEEFFHLVKQDPQNKYGNGQRQAAARKFVQFMEAWRGKPLDELPQEKAAAYSIVVGRERERGNHFQEDVINDIDLPLEQFMDHQPDWAEQLRLLIDARGFILQDIDAAGYLPRRKDLRDLLEPATSEEWAQLPRVLKTFEAWVCKKTATKRTGQPPAHLLLSPAQQVEQLQSVFCSEALPPSQVATSRFRSLTRGNKEQEYAVRNFTEFWGQHEGPLLDPCQGTVSFGRSSSAVPPRYRTCPLEEAASRAKRRREVYAQGRVPLDWTVEVPTAAGPLKIWDESGNCYATEEEAARAHQRQREQAQHDKAEDTGRKRSSTWSTITKGEAISASKEDGGRAIDSLRDLTLRKHEWRVVGLRGTGGALVPLASEEAAKLRPEDVSVVLRMDIKDTKRQLEQQYRLDWKLPEQYNITVNPRFGGNLVLVTDPKGRVFSSKYQLEMREKLESEQTRREQVTLKLPEAVQTLDRLGEGDAPVLELRGFQPGSKAARMEGLYTDVSQQQDAKSTVRFQKLLGLNLAGDEQSALIKLAGASEAGGGESARWAVSLGNEPNVLCSPVPAEGARTPDACCGWRLKQTGPKHKGEAVYAPAPEVKVCRLTARQALGRVVEVLQTPAVVCDFCCKPAVEASGGAQLVRPGSLAPGEPVTLRQMVAHMVERLLSVPEAAQGLPALAGSRLRVGTMCSGTDSPILAMNAIAKALEGRQGAFEVQHCFSCEIDKDKQLFLRKNFAFDALFNDVCELGDETAHDELSGQRVAVPTGLDIIIAGFSCKDLSGMNRFKKSLEEMGTSGTTLQGCLDYILRHRPRIAIFENVKNIALLDSATGLRPVDLVMEALKRLGYRAGWKFLNTRNYYLPQSRARVWMWGYRTGDAPDPKYRPVVSELAAELVQRDTAKQPASDAASAALNDKVSRTLEHLQRDAVIHFDDLISPDDDPHVRQDIEKRTGRDTNKVSISEKAKLTWDVKHKMHRDSLRNRYSKPYTSYRGAPWLRTLNEREKQLCDINFQEVYEARGIDARQVPMVWELSQSAGRVPGTKTAETQMHCTPCIVPGSLWHTTRRRFLLGREKLRFQGIFEEDLKDLDCVPESVLGDLAGNAFSATVCAANLLAALVFAEP